jgi:hypothetical protein
MTAVMLRGDDWAANDAHAREDDWAGPALSHLTQVPIVTADPSLLARDMFRSMSPSQQSLAGDYGRVQDE